MADVLQFDVVSFFVLLGMGFMSLVLSFYFYRKHRVLRDASKNLTVTVWDKTFNVFVPYETRRAITPFTLLPVFLVLLYFFLGFVILKILEMGLALSISVFILSLGFIMADEALDTRDHANVFINAMNKKAKFGKGDLSTLSLLISVMPKLSGYYVFTAAVFFALAYFLPHILSAMIFGMSLYFGTAIETASPIGVWMPYLSLFAFVLLFVMVYFAGGKLKNKVFGFPKSMPFKDMEEQFERGVRALARGERPPSETSHPPTLEDSEAEERKRKGLSSEE